MAQRALAAGACHRRGVSPPGQARCCPEQGGCPSSLGRNRELQYFVVCSADSSRNLPLKKPVVPDRFTGGPYQPFLEEAMPMLQKLVQTAHEERALSGGASGPSPVNTGAETPWHQCREASDAGRDCEHRGQAGPVLGTESRSAFENQPVPTKQR